MPLPRAPCRLHAAPVLPADFVERHPYLAERANPDGIDQHGEDVGVQRVAVVVNGDQRLQ